MTVPSQQVLLLIHRVFDLQFFDRPPRGSGNKLPGVAWSFTEPSIKVNTLYRLLLESVAVRAELLRLDPPQKLEFLRKFKRYFSS